MTETRKLDRLFFEQPAPVVAASLLGARLHMVGGVVARIVETEAYRQDDPASHSFRGPTKRNVVMFGPPGFLYMYFIYGMHWCTNVVTGPEGSGEAVLLRAATIEQGIEIVRDRRPKVRVDRALADGPGKLSAALGLSKAHYGLDVCGDGPVFFEGPHVPVTWRATARIGISSAREVLWRFVPG